MLFASAELPMGHRVRPVLAFIAASPAALAVRVPPPGGYGGTVQLPPQVHAIVIGGMPGWQIMLIAVAAAVIAATVAVIVDRAWAARRHLPGPGRLNAR